MTCIPKYMADVLKKAIRNKEIDIAKLAEMPTKERRAYFRDLTDEKLGKFINTEFEKALVSNKQDALTKWAQDVFTEKKNKPLYKDVIKKINSMNELDAFNDAGLEDLVMDKLGVNLTEEEANNILQKAEVLQALNEGLGSNLGRISHREKTTEFFVKKKELDDIITEINPPSSLDSLTNTIFRGNLLASLKSPVLNIISNATGGVVKTVERRLIGKGTYGLNGDVAAEYTKMARDIYQKSGYDITRMLSLNEEAGVSKILGERLSASKKTVIGQVAKVYEDTIFKHGLGTPDVAFSAFHFADSAKLYSTKLAKDMGLEGSAMQAKAKEILKDSFSFNPGSQGLMVREHAVGEALRSTYTSSTWYDQTALRLRDVLNAATGDLNLGSVLQPFVKTGANVIGQGIDASGVSAIRGLWNMVRIFKIDGAKGVQKFMPELAKELVVSGVGLTAAFSLSRLIEPENFMGAYDPQRYNIDKLKNSNYNAIKVGDKWISTEYLGPLAIPFTGIMYARKYKDASKVQMYGYGLVTQAKQIPGLEMMSDLIGKMTDSTINDTKDFTQKVTADTIGFFRSRFIPGILYDGAKAGDVERVTKGDTDIETAVNELKRSVPGLRGTLEEKKNLFGQTSKEEGFATILFFGARVKTERKDRFIAEIDRLDFNGYKPTMLDITVSKRKDVAEMKIQLGETGFGEASDTFRDNMSTNWQKVLDSPKYERMEDDERKKQLDKATEKAMVDTLKEYKVKLPKAKTKKVNYIIK